MFEPSSEKAAFQGPSYRYGNAVEIQEPRKRHINSLQLVRDDPILPWGRVLHDRCLSVMQDELVEIEAKIVLAYSTHYASGLVMGVGKLPKQSVNGTCGRRLHGGTPHWKDDRDTTIQSKY